MGRYVVLDVVFYGNSLNYDQGFGNYQELKKITKWDGKQYVMVSRYALRYSILEWANKIFPETWKLAGSDVLEAKEGEVVRPKIEANFEKIFEEYPEFDLFGFMSATKSDDISVTRTSPVKISHAVSFTPYNFDSHFSANLGMMRRAKGPGAGSNPVTIEEKKDFYVYNVVIDVNRVGLYSKNEHGSNKIGDIDVRTKRKERISQLVRTIFNLKREIKGRLEDLSPWLVICGLYNNGLWETFLDKIELAKSHRYKIITKEKEIKDKDGRTIKEIEHETIEKNAPKFLIDLDENKIQNVNTLDDIVKHIEEFIDQSESVKINKKDTNNTDKKIFVYKRRFIEIDYGNG